MFHEDVYLYLGHDGAKYTQHLYSRCFSFVWLPIFTIIRLLEFKFGGDYNHPYRGDYICMANVKNIKYGEKSPTLSKHKMKFMT